MTIISREEILKIARISSIYLSEDEIEPLRKQLEAVLSYAACVQEIAGSDVPKEEAKNSNVYRQDVIIRQDNEPILAQAPQVEGNYFVVPKVLENI